MNDLYAVGPLVERTIVGANGRVQTVVTVPFTTKPSGAQGTVDIPKEQYSADVADTLIRPYAAELERTAAL
jgi:hypothetical protein